MENSENFGVSSEKNGRRKTTFRYRRKLVHH